MKEKCHLDGCDRNPDMQLRAKLSSGDVVIPMCKEHAQDIAANRSGYEMYDASTIQVDLSIGQTITTIIKRFRKKVKTPSSLTPLGPTQPERI